MGGLLGSTTSCTQFRLAEVNVAGTDGPITAPENVYTDPSAPGASKTVGILKIDDSTIAPLRNALRDFFLSESGRANALIILNPSENVLVGQHWEGTCTAGQGHACLVAYTAEAVSGQWSSPYSDAGEQWPQVFQNLVQTNTDFPTSTNLIGPAQLNPALLNSIAVDLTEFDEQGNVSPSGPWARLLDVSPQEPAPGEPWLHMYPYPARTDLVLRLVFTGDVATIYPTSRGPTLVLEAKLLFPPDFRRENKVMCYGGLPMPYCTMSPAMCTTICKAGEEGIRASIPDWLEGQLVGSTCDFFHSMTNIASLRIQFKITPGVIPGCDPLAAWNPDDPQIGWMENLPHAIQVNGVGIPVRAPGYRQNCLRVYTNIGAVVETYPKADRASVQDCSSGVCINAWASECDGLIDEFCSSGAKDCDLEASKQAASTIAAQVDSQNFSQPGMGISMQRRLAPYFNYPIQLEEQGSGSNPDTWSFPPSPFGPFGRSTVRPLGCSLLDDPGCLDRVTEHYLPASLTSMIYGWFASPLGPRSGRVGRYPLLKVGSSCPAGTMPNGTGYGELDLGERGVCWGCGEYDWASLCPGRCGANGPSSAPCYGTRDPVKVHPTLELHYLADPDGDGILAPQDRCPFIFNTNAAMGDSDQDSVPDLCDNCPTDWNPEQLDLDGDGRGDGVCDPCDGNQPDFDNDGKADACESELDCPCDPTWLGYDSDGVCNYCDGTLGGEGSFCETRCGGLVVKPLDNCPAANNDDQANCNLDAEVAYGVEQVGDTCDPVPCPRFTPGYDTGHPLKEIVIPTLVGTTTTSWVPLDTIDLDPIGSRPVDWAILEPPGTVEIPVQVANTFYRYCVDIPPLDIRCNNPEYPQKSYFNNSTNVADEFSDSVWHRINVTSLASLEGADPLLTYGMNSRRSRAWDWKPDFVRWTSGANPWAAGLIPAEPADTGEGAGRLWVRGDSQVGVLESVGAGRRVIPAEKHPESDPGMLANHCEDVEMVTTETRSRARELQTKGELVFFAKWCLDCGLPELEIDRGCPQCGALVGKIDRSSKYETQPVFYLGNAVQPSAGVLNHDGSLTPFTIGAALSENLATNLTWLDAVEALPTIGGSRTAPAAVALSPDGTTLAEQVWLAGNRLVGQRDREIVSDELRSALADPAPVAGPAPRESFAGVYSRAEGQVYLVGGQALVSHAQLGDIWQMTVRGGSWSQVRPSNNYAPAKVMAATYSYRDRNLWILDEKRSGYWTMARLARVDPLTGEAQIVGAWPRIRLFDRHWLVLDRDGEVLLVASSSRLNRHVVARIRSDASGPELDGIRIAPRALAAAPAVDAEGYSFIVKHPGGKELRVIRLTDLDARPGGWIELGGCL